MVYKSTQVELPTVIVDAINLMENEFDLSVQNCNYTINDDGDMFADVSLTLDDVPLLLHYKPKASAFPIAQLKMYNILYSNIQYILLSDYINPAFAQKLKKAEIQFIDTSGNAFIKRPGIFIYVRGNKKIESRPVSVNFIGKAFNKKGLQLVYMLLKMPNVLSLSYREMANVANISLGIVGLILKDLDYQGYIDLKQRKLLKKGKLLFAWAEKHAYQIKKEGHGTFFTTEDERWFESISMDDLNILVGGDLAADKYTNYLRSNYARVYVNLNERPQFLRRMKLRKIRNYEDPKVKIELVEPYISVDTMKGSISGMADPLIVYAELLASDNVRNTEVAERIYEKYLRDY